MSAKRQKLLFPKLEKASLTAWSFTYSGKNSVTKIGSFPCPRGPDRCFWKLRMISLSPKRLWPFLIQKSNWTSRKKFYTECLFLWRPYYSILETFLGVLLSRVSVQVEISPLFQQRFPSLEPSLVPHLLRGSKFS